MVHQIISSRSGPFTPSHDWRVSTLKRAKAISEIEGFPYPSYFCLLVYRKQGFPLVSNIYPSSSVPFPGPSLPAHTLCSSQIILDLDFDITHRPQSTGKEPSLGPVASCFLLESSVSSEVSSFFLSQQSTIELAFQHLIDLLPVGPLDCLDYRSAQ